VVKRLSTDRSLKYSLPRLRAFRTSPGANLTGWPPVIALTNRLVCPTVAVLSLALCVVAFGEVFFADYAALCILVFILSSQMLNDVNVFIHWSAQVLARVFRTVVVGWAKVIGIILLLGYSAKLTDRFNYEVIVTWIAITPLLILASLKIIRMAIPRAIDGSTATRKAVVVGANYLGRVLAGRLQENPYLGVHVSGFFDDRSPERIGVAKGLIGKLVDVPDYVRRHGIHCVYISLPMTADPRLLRLIRELRDTTASVYFLPDYFVFDLLQPGFDNLAGIPVVVIRETPLFGLNAVIKRAIDLVLGAALVALAAPLMLAIAVAVKLDSPGPILFRQRRCGVDGQELVILKFRTMTVCEDGGQIAQAQRDDVRVTRLGAFLRKNSFDELPQLFNVLAGSMSIVGPRPHAVAHNEQYRKLIPGYMLRHKMKPGITGWAQINGFRGETETVDMMRRRVELDLDYVNNWSPLLDLWIITKTFFYGWNDSRAY
jgi:putative colanic acid biosysnthesis UDP-glucose lipid carrier transferase